MKKLQLLLLALLLFPGCVNYSQGSRTGRIIKLSYKGVFCKTWEGELSINAMNTSTDSNGNSSVSPYVWEFTVEDPQILPQIKQAYESGHTVKVEYNQELITFCRSDSNGYFVTAVSEAAGH